MLIGRKKDIIIVTNEPGKVKSLFKGKKYANYIIDQGRYFQERVMYNECDEIVFLLMAESPMELKGNIIRELNGAIVYADKYHKTITCYVVGPIQVKEPGFPDEIMGKRISEWSEESLIALVNEINSLHEGEKNKLFLREKLTRVWSVSIIMFFAGIPIYYLFSDPVRNIIDHILTCVAAIIFVGFCLLIEQRCLYNKYEIRRITRSGHIMFDISQYEYLDIDDSDRILSVSVQEKRPVKPEQLMRKNIENISEYYEWSKSQAKMAFGLAIFFSVIGILIIGVSLYIGVTAKDNATSVVITGIAGAIVELISVSFIVVYKVAAEQLSYYHKALHTDQRFLTSFSLINEITDEALKNEVRASLIKKDNSDGEKK